VPDCHRSPWRRLGNRRCGPSCEQLALNKMGDVRSQPINGPGGSEAQCSFLAMTGPVQQRGRDQIAAPEEVIDDLSEFVPGVRRGLAQAPLRLGEQLLDRVQVGAVGRQAEARCAGCGDRLADAFDLAAAVVTLISSAPARPPDPRKSPRPARAPYQLNIPPAASHQPLVSGSCSRVSNVSLPQFGHLGMRSPWVTWTRGTARSGSRRSSLHARLCAQPSLVSWTEPGASRSFGRTQPKHRAPSQTLACSRRWRIA
jgi:hypothetical protein